MSVQVLSCTLQDLFAANVKSIRRGKIKGQLKIPEYQRPYVWQEKQLKKLVNDLKVFFEAYKDGLPLYYLGSVIIHQDESHLNIIDGQQRITTLALLNYVVHGKDHDIEFSSPRSIQQIKENYQLFLNKDVVIDQLDLGLLNVTLVITKSEDDAYTFFETQNTGGKRLSGADIVKAHHLRAIEGKGAIADKAQQWESKSIKSIDAVVGIISKARFWNFLKWETYPSFRQTDAIKAVVVRNFTEETAETSESKSFYQIEVVESDFQKMTKISGLLKAMRQPVYDGSHFIDYLSDYVDVYEDLFLKSDNYRIDKRFYEFRDMLITGKNGTIFLQELFQLIILAYVSKFGLKDLFEFSLWCFRSIYSIRVANRRTVREESIEKLIRHELFLDKVLNSYTHTEALSHLKNYRYTFNEENCEPKRVKGQFIISLGGYFPAFSNRMVTSSFDRELTDAIDEKIRNV